MSKIEKYALVFVIMMGNAFDSSIETEGSIDNIVFLIVLMVSMYIFTQYSEDKNGQ